MGMVGSKMALCQTQGNFSAGNRQILDFDHVAYLQTICKKANVFHCPARAFSPDA
jgi:hypothetical protein